MKTIIALIIPAMLLFPASAGAENIALIGSYDTPGSAKGVYVSGGHAYVSCWQSGLVILNVTDPTSPELEGQIAISPWQTWDAHVWGHCAYLANDVTNGLAIVDVADPAHPTLLGECDTPGWAYNLAVDGAYAYIADGYTGYFQIIDITDPINPAPAASYNTNGWARGVCISGSFAYLANGQDFNVLDISDPRNPVLRATWRTSGSMMAISVSGSYAFVIRNRNNDSSLVVVADVSNPDTIVIASTYLLPVHAWDIFIHKEYAYIANSNVGLTVLNISDPDSLVRIGGYDTPGEARHVFVHHNLIYVADDSSLLILQFDPTAVEDDASPPVAPALLNSYPNPFNARVTIEYALPREAEVALDIYDIRGRRVAKLSEGVQPAGYNSLIWDAEDPPSGVYFVRLKAGEFAEVRKMTLLK